jgi:hypothetical protein
MAQSKWYSEQPKNRNFLAPVGFKLELDVFEGVDFFCQKANIPDISVPFIEAPTRFRNVPLPGAGGIQTGDLNVTFIIDEDLHNYMQIQNWIKKFGLYESHTEEGAEDFIYSNARLLITTSNFNIDKHVYFENIFPVSLTDIRFDVGDTDVEYFTAEVSFKYQSFELRDRLNKPL